MGSNNRIGRHHQLQQHGHIHEDNVITIGNDKLKTLIRPSTYLHSSKNIPVCSETKEAQDAHCKHSGKRAFSARMASFKQSVAWRSSAPFSVFRLRRSSPLSSTTFRGRISSTSMVVEQAPYALPLTADKSYNPKPPIDNIYIYITGRKGIAPRPLLCFRDTGARGRGAKYGEALAPLEYGG